MYLLVYRKNPEQKKLWNAKTYISIYALIVLFVSVVMFANGWSKLNLSMTAQKYGVEFSYQPQWKGCPYPERVVTKDPSDTDVSSSTCVDTYEYDALAMKRDMVQGITLMITALVIGLVHCLFILKLRKTEEFNWVWQKFLVLGLLLFGVTSLVSIPVAIFRTINFFLYGAPTTEFGYVNYELIAGDVLGTAIAFTPIWILFLIGFLKNMKTHKEK